jgi:hypothetical protein
MAKKKIFLHIGTEKTGTKSIQYFCSKEQKYLRDNDLYYPIDQKSACTYNITHWPLVASIVPYKTFLPDHKVVSPEESYGSLVKMIERNSCSRVLVSAEPFSSLVTDYDQLCELKKRLNGFDVKIVVYLRKQDDSFISRISTNVKGGRFYPGNNFDFKEAFYKDDLYNYENLLERWSSIFGKENLIVKCFDKPLLKNESILDDFLDIFNIAIPETYNQICRRNKSLTLECLFFLNELNGLFELNWQERNQLHMALETIQSGQSIMSLLSNKERKRILNHYKTSNKNVANVYFQRNTLFLSRNEKYKKYKKSDDSDHIISHLENLVNRNKFPQKLLCKIKEKSEINIQRPSILDDINWIPQEVSQDVKKIYRKGRALCIQSSGNDPWFILNLKTSEMAKELTVFLDIVSSQHSTLQLFYSDGESDFSSDRQVNCTMHKGKHKINLSIKSESMVRKIRVDISSSKGLFSLDNIHLKRKYDTFEMRKDDVAPFDKKNKTPTIYIHLGLHKTATSSIQATLYDNRAVLNELGYSSFNQLQVNHSHPVHSLFTEFPEKYHMNIREGMDTRQIYEFNEKNRRIMLDELKNSDFPNYIISGEGIGVLSREGLRLFNDFIYSCIPKANIKIIISTRETYSFLESAVQHTIKSGVNPSIKQLKKRAENLYKWNISKIIDVFGKEKICIYSFEDACKNKNGPVGYFLSTIGISEKEIERFSIMRRNESCSDRAIELMEYINNAEPLFNGNKISKMRSVHDLKPFHNIRGGKYTLGSNIVDEIDASEDRKWLFNEFGIDYLGCEYTKDRIIVYDDYYYDVVIECVQNSKNDLINHLIFDFISEKCSETTEMNGLNVLNKLRNDLGDMIN